MKRTPVIPLLVWAVAGISGTLSAQEKWTINIIPRVGLISPDLYLYEEFANFADDEPAEWTTGSLGRAAVLGAALEVTFPDRGISVRGDLSHTFGGWLSAVHGIITPRVYYQPPEIINTWLDVPASMTFANVQVILPTRFKPLGIQPFASIGGGGKWYHFGASTRPNEVEAILPSPGFTPAVVLGGGFSFSLYGLVFETQIYDSINKYWGKTQHDVLLSQGLAWRIR